MVAEKQVEPFCKAVSQFLLSGGLGGRDAVGGEDPFAQAVYDAMSLARRPGDSVSKEYKVNPVVRDSNATGRALDIVYIPQLQTDTSQQPQPQQRYCFMLNVKVQRLALAGKEWNWEKQVEISRKIYDLTDDAVLNLALAQSTSTVRKVLDKAVKDAQDIYLPEVKGEVGEANVHCWALVRVGIARIVWRKVL